MLEDILARLDALPESDKAALRKEVLEKTRDAKFIPSVGPQTQAWFSPADLLLYGGEAGGGKSGLLCGLALEEHMQSLIMRRNGVDLEGGGGLIEDLLRLYGSRDGFSGKPPPTLRTRDERIITFGAASNIGDELKYIGRARDLLGVDEAAQFAETQVRALMGWVRTVHEGQRTRSIFATNPPMTSEGEWIIRMFRPWLDPTHANPAEHGELRWFITVKDGASTVDIEVDGPEPIERDGDTFIPTSRTFIPARLSDNPFIIQDQYQKQLDALPEPYRSAARDGNFMAVRSDDELQVIPTAWVMEAQRRWSPEPPDHAPMCAMGVDIAQGGSDDTVISCRYDGWFGSLEVVAGEDTPTGAEVAGLIISRRRNNADIILDMGGGWGGDTAARLRDNGIEPQEFIGGSESSRRGQDQKYRFVNKRAEAWARLAEALNPGQDGGSEIALPPDPELVADLTAPRYDEKQMERGRLQVEAKAEIKKRLGRSPDRGDAVVMAWFGGPRLLTHGNLWRKASAEHRPNAAPMKVIMGRSSARRRRH